ncbi:MAG: hypothetical protein IPJ04_18720 [Candidatus Eisenbacteria bacterium]|nr:hypothetical protein [Candidatus Eisenbacteria bacterium]
MPHGTCVWADLDCDACTGFGGNETQSRWSDPGARAALAGLSRDAGRRRRDRRGQLARSRAGRADGGAQGAPVRFSGHNV